MCIVSREFCQSLEGGWQLQASFSQSFLLQFWKSQCPSGSKYPEFSKTPPAFAFWMSLKVVMAVSPLNTIFLGHPVHDSIIHLIQYIYCLLWTVNSTTLLCINLPPLLWLLLCADKVAKKTTFLLYFFLGCVLCCVSINSFSYRSNLVLTPLCDEVIKTHDCSVANFNLLKITAN